MSYTIFRDTLGNGLETIPGIGLTIVSEDELAETVSYVVQLILDEDGFNTIDEYEDAYFLKIAEEIVICEISEFIGGIEFGEYVKTQFKPKISKDYELYLKLKERFGST